MAAKNVLTFVNP